jgi:hypothetical protein
MSLSHLRPLSFGEILDGAFVLYRRHFSTFFTTAIIPLLPVALLWGVFGYLTGGAGEFTASFGLLFLAVYPVMIVGTMLVWGALIHETSRAVEGGSIDRGEAYRVSLRRMLPGIAAGFLFLILCGLGMVLLIVPGILVCIALFATWHVVVIEGRGPVEALSRSRELARGAWGRIFGVMLVATIIIMIPSMLVGATTGAMLAGAVLTSGDPDAVAGAMGTFSAVNNVLSILLSALTTPFLTAALTVLYYDRRVRTEALDLEMATERLGVPA